MTHTTRREFLGSAALSGLAFGHLVAAEANRERLRIGLLGAGGYGLNDAKAALKVGGVEIVAVCDVDQDHLDKASGDMEQLQGSRPRGFKHYEEMLDMPGLEAVIIATPPHWHALNFLAALQRGLHIYCEKPLSYDIREGRAMVEAARQSKGVVQIGFQRRQSKAFAAAKKFIDEGQAGRIVQADVQIHYRAGILDTTPQQPPATLDWDLWCGPAPKLPYSPQIGHRNWRLEKTTGHGHLVDWGIHNIDATRMVLDLDMPRQVTAAGGIYQLQGKITTPDTLTVHFEFARCPVVWRHRLWGAVEYDPEVSNGVFFYGDQATVFASDRKWVVIRPDNQREEHEEPSDLGLDHMADFLHAVQTGQPCSGKIDEAFRSTATVHLGMIAFESGATVRWNAQTEQIEDNPAAAALLKREYRPPYAHPYRG